MLSYIAKIKELVDQVEAEETDHIRQAAGWVADALENGHAIYVFGASHASILSQELFYRAGGLLPVTPIFGREIMLDTAPVTKTSQMEQLEGYGRILANSYPLSAGDVLLIHSVSGRNPVAIDLALAAKEKGVRLIGITSRAYSASVSSRHSSGKKLMDLCDLILDNHGEIGDACCPVEGLPVKVGASSTVIGCLMVNAMMVEVVERIQKNKKIPAPVFYSANLDGGAEKNQELFERFRQQIHYSF